jgi:hypothetical protein
MVCAIANTGDTLVVTLPLLPARRYARRAGWIANACLVNSSISVSILIGRPSAARPSGNLNPRTNAQVWRRPAPPFFALYDTKPARVRILLRGARTDEARFAWVPARPRAPGWRNRCANVQTRAPGSSYCPQELL